MNKWDYIFIENNLQCLLQELKKQPEVAKFYPTDSLSYEKDMDQITEYIELAGEYGLAYECIVGDLEMFPFKVSGAAAVKLLELGLIMKFKTEADEDKDFDIR